MRRLVSLPLAALFLLAVGGEAYGYHSCSHHDALPGGGSEHAEAPAGASHAADLERDGPDGTGHAGGDHPCTCVGLCHGSAAAPIATVPHAGLGSSAPLPVAFVRPDAGAAVPQLLPYVLPLANAPPHTR